MDRRLWMGLSTLSVAVVTATAPTWTATLAPTDGSSIGGTATVGTAAKDGMKSDSAGGGYGALVASLTLTGAKPRATLVWFIHEGKCGGEGPIVGDEGSYRPALIDEKGTGKAVATVSAPMTNGKDYRVEVHGGASKTSPVVACGNLAPEGGRQTPDR